MLSQDITYSQARANLATMLDQVHDDRQIVVIRRRNHKDVALIAESELSSPVSYTHLTLPTKA